MLILESPWTRQPQTVAQPNLRSELLSGAALFMPFNGHTQDLISGKLATLGAGASTSVDLMGRALYGSGSAAVASIPVNLSSVGIVSVSFWLYWPAYANDYDMALEYTADGGANAGFYISPNAASGNWQFAASSTAGGPYTDMARYSAGLHHYAININRNKDANAGAFEAFVDGESASLFAASGSARAGNFDNSTLYILSRNNASLFGNGSIRNLVVRPGVALTQRQAKSEYRNPWQLFAPRQIYIPTAAATGYTHPTLSLATATEIGTTSFKPRVTYTFA